MFLFHLFYKCRNVTLNHRLHEVMLGLLELDYMFDYMFILLYYKVLVLKFLTCLQIQMDVFSTIQLFIFLLNNCLQIFVFSQECFLNKLSFF